MRVKTYRKRALFLLLLFTAYWCGISFFTHSHVENGSVIVHSHPFKAAHHHTEKQYETIFYITYWCSPEVTLPDTVGSPYFVLLAVYPIEHFISVELPDYSGHLYLRGPPSVWG